MDYQFIFLIQLSRRTDGASPNGKQYRYLTNPSRLVPIYWRFLWPILKPFCLKKASSRVRPNKGHDGEHFGLFKVKSQNFRTQEPRI